MNTTMLLILLPLLSRDNNAYKIYIQLSALGGNILYHHIHIVDNKTILSVVVNVLFKLR